MCYSNFSAYILIILLYIFSSTLHVICKKRHELSVIASLPCTLTCQFHPIKIRRPCFLREERNLTVLPALSSFWFSSLLDKSFLQGCQIGSHVLFYSHNTLNLLSHGYISPLYTLYDLNYERQAWKPGASLYGESLKLKTVCFTPLYNI